MNLSTFKKRIAEHPQLKTKLHNLIMHPIKTRPRWWVRAVYFLYLKRGKGSVIYSSVRKDLPPFNKFYLGKYSVIEDFSCINNAVGDLIIGDYSRIGLRNTIIGPVTIGNDVHTAQNVTVSGLNHNYQDVTVCIDKQGVSTNPIIIEDDVWIGCGCRILSGIKIGRRSIVAAGAVVAKDIENGSLVGGVPARLIKRLEE